MDGRRDCSSFRFALMTFAMWPLVARSGQYRGWSGWLLLIAGIVANVSASLLIDGTWDSMYAATVSVAALAGWFLQYKYETNLKFNIDTAIADTLSDDEYKFGYAPLLVLVVAVLGVVSVALGIRTGVANGASVRAYRGNGRRHVADGCAAR